jgi:hypothetical protein
MHVEHVLFFKLKMTSEEEAWVIQEFQNLKNKIDVILEVKFGPTFTHERSHGYTHGLRVKFAKPEDLKVYGPHEDHQVVAKWLREHAVEPAICLDF